MKTFLLFKITVLFFNSFIAQASTTQAIKTPFLCPSDEYSCDFSSYKPLRISHFITTALKNVEPNYPLTAKSVKAQGKVIVRILVNRKGDVVEVCVIEGHPLLRANSIKAAKQWKFKKDFGLTPTFKPNRRYIETELIFNFTLPE